MISKFNLLPIFRFSTLFLLLLLLRLGPPCDVRINVRAPDKSINNSFSLQHFFSFAPRILLRWFGVCAAIGRLRYERRTTIFIFIFFWCTRDCRSFRFVCVAICRCVCWIYVLFSQHGLSAVPTLYLHASVHLPDLGIHVHVTQCVCVCAGDDDDLNLVVSIRLNGKSENKKKRKWNGTRRKRRFNRRHTHTQNTKKNHFGSIVDFAHPSHCKMVRRTAIKKTSLTRSVALPLAGSHRDGPHSILFIFFLLSSPLRVVYMRLMDVTLH